MRLGSKDDLTDWFAINLASYGRTEYGRTRGGGGVEGSDISEARGTDPAD